MKTSLRVSLEVVGITLIETQREANAYAFPLPSVVDRELPTFLRTTALQHCKLSILLAEVGGFLPALSFQLSIDLLPFTSSSRFEIGYATLSSTRIIWSY